MYYWLNRCVLDIKSVLLRDDFVFRGVHCVPLAGSVVLLGAHAVVSGTHVVLLGAEIVLRSVNCV